MSDHVINKLAETVADHLALSKERAKEMLFRAVSWRCKGDCPRRDAVTWAEWRDGRAIVHTCGPKP